MTVQAVPLFHWDWGWKIQSYYTNQRYWNIAYRNLHQKYLPTIGFRDQSFEGTLSLTSQVWRIPNWGYREYLYPYQAYQPILLFEARNHALQNGQSDPEHNWHNCQSAHNNPLHTSDTEHWNAAQSIQRAYDCMQIWLFFQVAPHFAPSALYP